MNDAKFNNLIGVEEKKQIACLEEIDGIAAGRQDYLPFSGTNWDEEIKKRDANV